MILFFKFYQNMRLFFFITRILLIFPIMVTLGVTDDNVHAF